MATARKLPSGNYRVRVYDKYSRTYKSFTHSDKKIAQRMADEWLCACADENDGNITLKKATELYIDSKCNVLSPTTLQGYNKMLRCNMNRLLDIRINDLKSQLIQDWVNELTVSKSAKTVHNVYGLLTAVLNYYDCNIRLSKIKLPAKTRKFKRLPSADIVIDAFSGTDIELPVLLGMWCGFRLSEILGIRKIDIQDNVLTINQVAVTVNGALIVKKNAKNYNSNRQMKLPFQIMNLINRIDKTNTELLIDLTSRQIYGRFKKQMNEYGYLITFHDLRHINASIMSALNIPDQYAMERGGWSNTSTLKTVYQQTFTDKRNEIDETIDNYFSNIYDTKYATKYTE